jgi:hypothetical protein
VGVLDRPACGAEITGLGTVAGAALRASIGPIAKPHTSQKSSSADSCPDGQVAISLPADKPGMPIYL